MPCPSPSVPASSQPLLYTNAVWHMNHTHNACLHPTSTDRTSQDSHFGISCSLISKAY